MNSALIAKELRQHWLVFLITAVLIGIIFLLLTAGTIINESGSVFEALRLFLYGVIPFATMAICNRLVVQEYQAKTQLFLEALPVSRLRMIIVKWFFGIALLFGFVTSAFLFLCLLGNSNEILTGRFIGIVLARTYGYTACVYAFFFMTGLLGRYRVAIYLMAIIGAFTVDTMTNLELAEVGPFDLINDEFSYERTLYPRNSLAVTIAATLGFVGLTFCLALIREGSVATLLAERMSHREKVFITVTILTCMAAVSIYDSRIEREPFDLPDAVEVITGPVRVKVSFGDSKREAIAQELAEDVAEDVQQLVQYLHLNEVARIFLVERRDLDADRFEVGELDNAEGLLVRLNFTNESFSQAKFRSWLIRELLLQASHNRLRQEHLVWVLDGFSLYWLEISAGAGGRSDVWNLRAAYALRQGLSVNDFQRWFTYRERVGQPIASAAAWSLLRHIDATHGESACQDFLRRVLDPSRPPDLRSTLYDFVSPPESTLERITGEGFKQTCQTWLASLQVAARDQQSKLDSIPVLSAAVTVSRVSESSRVLQFVFGCSPPPVRGRFQVKHATLPPFDDEVNEEELELLDLGYDRDRESELPQTFDRGTRLYYSFSVFVEAIDCELSTGWTRRELR